MAISERFALGAQAGGFISFSSAIVRKGSSGDDLKKMTIPAGMISIGSNVNGRGFVIEPTDYTFDLPSDLTADTSYLIIANAPPASVGDGIVTFSHEEFSTYSGDTNSRRAFCYFVTNDSSEILSSTIRTYDTPVPNEIWGILAKAGLYVNKQDSDYSYSYRGQNFDEKVAFVQNVDTGHVVYKNSSGIYDLAIADDSLDHKEVFIGIGEVDRGDEYSLSGTMSAGQAGNYLLSNYVMSGGIVSVPNNKLPSTIFTSGSLVYLSDTTAGQMVADFDYHVMSSKYNTPPAYALGETTPVAKNYNVGDRILGEINSAGDKEHGIIYIWECTVAGTSSASEPTWPTGSLETTTKTDNAITWKKLAYYGGLPESYPTGTGELEEIVLKADPSGVYHIWEVTSTTGSYTTEPTWPLGDIGTTVQDAGNSNIVWTKRHIFDPDSLSNRKVRVGVSLGGDGTNTEILIAPSVATSIDDHNDASNAHPDILRALEKAGIYVVNPMQGRPVSNVSYQGQHFDEKAVFPSDSPTYNTVAQYDIVYKDTTDHRYSQALAGGTGNINNPIGMRLSPEKVACGTGFYDYDASSFTAGDKLYLSNTTAGAITTTETSVFLGYCVNSDTVANGGCIYLMIDEDEAGDSANNFDGDIHVSGDGIFGLQGTANTDKVLDWNTNLTSSTVEIEHTTHGLNSGDFIYIGDIIDGGSFTKGLYLVGSNTTANVIEVKTLANGAIGDPTLGSNPSCSWFGPTTDALIDNAGIKIPGTKLHEFTFNDTSQVFEIKSSDNLTGLKINATTSIILPKGTTGERPGTPESGMFRYNSDNTELEYYSSAWTGVSSKGFSVAMAVALG